MAGYWSRARALVQNLFGSAPLPTDKAAGTVERIDDHLVLVDGRLRFADADRLTEPAAWLDLFTIASSRNVAIDRLALGAIERRLAQTGSQPLLPPPQLRDWLLVFLRPRPGLARSLADMRDCGLLARLLPAAPAARASTGGQQGFAAIAALEGLSTEKTLSAERFGAMLGELGEPELLPLTILLRDPGIPGRPVEESLRNVQRQLAELAVSADAQHTVDFLIRNQLQVSQTAFRRDTNDPEVIRKFAALFSTEDQLKLLFLLTLADASAAPGGLTPWKAELLWRLYVDAYNQLTMAYGDDIIDQSEAAIAALHANRPQNLSAAELERFLQGLPRRYLTLFDPETIYEHVQLCRDLSTEDVRIAVKKRPSGWELTVATTDKPYLFSNVCGVLSYLDLDILRGHALTSLTSVVIDVFHFTQRSAAFDESRLRSLLLDVIAGRQDVTELVREKERTLPAGAAERSAPVIYFDNDASQRYTVLELLADDSPGLLYRISRALSSSGVSVELVLIATEGHKAVDVFHLKKDDAKLADADQLALTEELERALR